MSAWRLGSIWGNCVTVVCEQCARLGETFPSVEGRLELDAFRGTVECRNGHRLRVERDGR